MEILGAISKVASQSRFSQTARPALHGAVGPEWSRCFPIFPSGEERAMLSEMLQGSWR